MSAQFVSPDAMMAAAAEVEREYVYGCRIAVESAVVALHGAGIFLVRASDGSEFRLYADKFGNVSRLPDDYASRSAEGRREALSEVIA